MTTNSWEFKTVCFPNELNSTTLFSDHFCYMINQTPVLKVDVERATYFMSMSLAPANTPEFARINPHYVEMLPACCAIL